MILSPTSLNRLTITFGQPAVLLRGITLYPGTTPPYVDFECMGEALYQDIYGIFENTGETYGFVEILQ